MFLRPVNHYGYIRAIGPQNIVFMHFTLGKPARVVQVSQLHNVITVPGARRGNSAILPVQHLLFQHCSATCGLSALLRNVWSLALLRNTWSLAALLRNAWSFSHYTLPNAWSRSNILQRVFCFVLFVCFCFLTILSYAWSFNPWVWSDTSGNMWVFQSPATLHNVWPFGSNIQQRVVFRQ